MKKIYKPLDLIPLKVYNKSIEKGRKTDRTRKEGKNMKGTKKYIEQREIFDNKDQALDFIAANKVLLISLREKDGMWCLKYLQEA